MKEPKFVMCFVLQRVCYESILAGMTLLKKPLGIESGNINLALAMP